MITQHRPGEHFRESQEHLVMGYPKEALMSDHAASQLSISFPILM